MKETRSLCLTPVGSGKKLLLLREFHKGPFTKVGAGLGRPVREGEAPRTHNSEEHHQPRDEDEERTAGRLRPNRRRKSGRCHPSLGNHDSMV